MSREEAIEKVSGFHGVDADTLRDFLDGKRADAVRPIGRGAVCPAEPPTWQINPERAASRVAYTDPAGRNDGARQLA